MKYAFEFQHPLCLRIKQKEGNLPQALLNLQLKEHLLPEIDLMARLNLFLAYICCWRHTEGRHAQKWAASGQNQQKAMCAQRRLRSAWASAQSDQSLHCPPEETLWPQLPMERTVKTLIRLGGCPGWPESSLDTQLFCWFCHEAAQIVVCIFFATSDVTPLVSDFIMIKWALSWENLSSGFVTRVDSHRPVQPQKLRRGLKFRI